MRPSRGRPCPPRKHGGKRTCRSRHEPVYNPAFSVRPCPLPVPCTGSEHLCLWTKHLSLDGASLAGAAASSVAHLLQAPLRPRLTVPGPPASHTRVSGPRSQVNPQPVRWGLRTPLCRNPGQGAGLYQRQVLVQFLPVPRSLNLSLLPHRAAGLHSGVTAFPQGRLAD